MYLILVRYCLCSSLNWTLKSSVSKQVMDQHYLLLQGHIHREKATDCSLCETFWISLTDAAVKSTPIIYALAEDCARELQISSAGVRVPN